MDKIYIQCEYLYVHMYRILYTCQFLFSQHGSFQQVSAVARLAGASMYQDEVEGGVGHIESLLQ